MVNIQVVNKTPQITVVPHGSVKVIPPSQNSVPVDVNSGGGSTIQYVEEPPFEYLMPVAQTTATFTHTLGHDPTAVQVFVDGQLCDEYTVVFPVPNQVVRVGFDVSVKALIRIS